MFNELVRNSLLDVIKHITCPSLLNKRIYPLEESDIQQHEAA